MVPLFHDWFQHVSDLPAQVIVIYSTKESQLMFPRDWQDERIAAMTMYFGRVFLHKAISPNLTVKEMPHFMGNI